MAHDVLVIGGSYAGLTAALLLARGGRDVCVIDAGKPRNRFASASHGSLGLDGKSALDVLAQGQSDLKRYDTVSMVQGLASKAAQDPSGKFVVILESGEIRTATKLVLAFGIVDLLPEIQGVEARWGKTVNHCPYCHGVEFKGQQLGVLNTHPISVHQALMLPDWGPTTFFLNGLALPDDGSRENLQKRSVRLEEGVVIGLEGEGTSLAGVRMADGRLVSIGGLYLVPKTRLSSSLAEELGCELVESPTGPIIKTDEGKMTTVPGVYAAGDIASCMASVIFASADGALAAAFLHQAMMFAPPTEP
jgi:thioredoxin reductase